MTELSDARGEPATFPRDRSGAEPADAGGPASGGRAAAAWLAESLRGVTLGRVSLFLLLVALLALGSTPTARAVGYGHGIARIAESFVDTFALLVLGYGAPTLAIIAVANRTPPRSRRRIAALVATVVLGSALTAACLVAGGALIGIRISVGFRAVWSESMAELAAICVMWLLLVRRDDARNALQRAQLDRITAERQLAEARLMTLQSQIEPHFLFNTLANVRRLLQTDRSAGRAMVQQLTRYLEATLPALRDARSSLGREMALTAAYLDVQRIRMGVRLQTAFDVPDALAAARFPPMMLMTLVENAIKHGLAPLPEGGCVVVTAEQADGRLRVRVRDTGAGFKRNAGKGIGIANTRARLHAVYGGAARLSLTDSGGGGVTATIEVPLQFDDGGRPAP